MISAIPAMLLRSVCTLSLAALIALPAVAAEDDIPRMADGKPDLSGFYDVATLTPLQRPEQYGDNLFLTGEEAQAIEEEERALLAKANEKSAANRAAPSDTGAAPVGFDDSQRENLGAGNVGGYNAFWIDRGSSAVSIDGAYRTSIISEPANGRMPSITDAARERRAVRRALTPFRANTGVAWWIQEGGADAPGPYDDIEQRPPRHGALHPARRGHPSLRVHRRGPLDLDPALEGRLHLAGNHGQGLTSTPATKATTRWATSCAARGCSKRRLWRPPPERAAASRRPPAGDS